MQGKSSSIFNGGDMMASKFFIKMDHVSMNYPSAVYNSMSIKQEVFARLRGEKQKPLLKDIQALRNFTLHVREGERVGVIGHNGAGKSTLLKTIAGIYPIEEGNISVNGKIRALFEISLGFDMESTGRENILYRGLLLGATPDEIKEKSEEIIRFADLGEFIDYPVKSYSSGMAVRLAFAVSTCIKGEILLLDEILGAGDASFQEKAKKRIFDLIDEAKLMVFVTHNLQAMQEICNRAILMERGQIVFDGKPEDAVEIYLKRP